MGINFNSKLQRRIEYVDIKTVNRWKENPKSPKLMAANAKEMIPLIQKNGFNTPLVCWSKNRTIYKGNTTHLASEMMKLDKVPVIFVDFEDERAATLYGLSDNNAGAKSEWDMPMLKKLMVEKELHVPGDEAALQMLTGFKEKQLKLILEDDAEPDPENVGKKGTKFDVANVSFPASIEENGFIHDTLRDVKAKYGVKLTSEAVMIVFNFFNENAE